MNTDLNGYNYIVPCGQPGQAVTSMRQVLGVSLDLTKVKDRFSIHFAKSFGYAETARHIGFINVASGPLVRSSYRAAEMSHTKDPAAVDDITGQPFEAQTRRRQYANFK